MFSFYNCGMHIKFYFNGLNNFVAVFKNCFEKQFLKIFLKNHSQIICEVKVYFGI